MRFAMSFSLVCLCGLAVLGFEALADDIPSGVVNTQNPNDVSLSRSTLTIEDASGLSRTTRIPCRKKTVRPNAS